MKQTGKLLPQQLCNRCDPSQFRFETTADLEELTQLVGQPRAIDAIQFGIGIQREGYHLFAMGPNGVGKHTTVRRFLDQRAATEEIPSDWCYVHNFQQAHKPRALRFPPGQAQKIKRDMDRLVEDLRTAILAAFETDEYRVGHREIDQELSGHREKALEELRARAARQDLALIQTSDGSFMFVPMRKGEAIDPEAFSKLDEKERHRIETITRGFLEDLEKVFQQIPKLRQDRARKIRELNRRVTQVAVSALIDELQKQYDKVPEVQKYLAEVQDDIVDHAENFRQPKEGEQVTPFGMPLPQAEAAENALRRYRVNVLVDHSESKGAPVIYEDNLTYNNLVGRIEHLQQMGVLVTDFTLIKAGALHRANGGYLIIEVLKLLQQPFAWDGLKRALRSREIHIESLGQMLSLISTVSLEPEPIPLNLKVVLVGERLLYYLLHYFDPDFSELFKVVADFNETMESGLEANLVYARLIGSIARKEGLRQFDRPGVARVIEHSSRLAADTEKLSIEMQKITDLLREADYWAGKANRQTVTADDVQRAIDTQQYRADRLRDRLQEEIQRGTILIDTAGEKVGQVNGLSVLQLGNFSFGHPSRITARVRLGSGKVIDIEREVELGGPIHSKGVLILSGFLAGRYVPDRPLSLSASLVFEQSYAGVEGDSASSAELYALLSALAEVPIKQSFVVTGSVNQHGEIQAIGGVNEKIEGFFDVCKAQGLTGEHGVLIPAANLKHLMLRQEVIDAAATEKFHIYAVKTIDEGIEILTGFPAGRRNEQGEFPTHSINQKVERRLIQFAEQARVFHAGPQEEKQMSGRGRATPPPGRAPSPG